MAEWLGNSNQKLYQARLLLERLLDEREGPARSTSDSEALGLALQQSVLFQLVLSYQSYLHEIAEIAQCRESFSSLRQLMALVPIATGEMTELNQLEEDDFSWLSQLLSAFDACSQKDNASPLMQRNAGMINMHDKTPQFLPLRDWYQSLSDIIDIQRNNRQES